ncbi:MAG: HAMP domain-containing protein [Burkholderiales bacterium]|nr:MAG: HAMP domain-containing protein [Burkholderiales bacterium]
MKRIFRVRHWSVKAKLVGLLLSATVVPLLVSYFMEIHETNKHGLRDMQQLLSARGEQLARELDSIHTGYLRSTQRLAYQPAIADFCASQPDAGSTGAARVHGIFSAFPKSDANIRGVALINQKGVITVATDAPLVGADVSGRATVQSAREGKSVISDIYVSTASGQELPTVAYLVPVVDSGEVLCVLALWVHAETVWGPVRVAHGRAGQDSFAVIYDKSGIRIGHSFRQNIVFRPGGPLVPGLVARLVATQRFGAKTQELLEDVRPFPLQFERATAEAPSPDVFRGFATANNTWNYGVASRLKTVPWTVFYMTPEAAVLADLADITRSKTILALLVVLIAVAVGIVFAAAILRPVSALSKASDALASGNWDIRVPAGSNDELGLLGARFNAMADQIQRQADALRRSHDELRLYANGLEGANKDLEAFAFSVSHDLRAPLGVVEGFSKILEDKHAAQLDGKALHYLRRIRAGVTQMGQLVEGILRLSRLNRQQLVLENVDVRSVVLDVAEELRLQNLLADGTLTLTDDLGDAWADRVLLRQVFANLMSNACKFSSRQTSPRIIVGSELVDEERLYFVRDNGAGFDQAFAKQLFEPFTRLEHAEEYAGLGIGLSIVQRVVEKHGGRIWAEAEVGIGASFYFTLGTSDAQVAAAGPRLA